MKKSLLAALLFIAMPLAACNQTSGGSGGEPGPETYTPSKVEKEVIDFLKSREIELEKIEPLHSFEDDDLLYSEQEDDFYFIGEQEYCPYYAGQLRGNVVETILTSMSTNEWTVPTTPDEDYGYECVNKDETVEIDVFYDDDPEYLGTWIYVYSYADLNDYEEDDEIATEEIVDGKFVVTFNLALATSYTDGDSLNDIGFYSDYCVLWFRQGEGQAAPAYYGGEARLYFGNFLRVSVSLGYIIESISLPNVTYKENKSVNLDYLEAEEGTLSINGTTVNVDDINSDTEAISVTHKPTSSSKTDGNIRISTVVVTLDYAPDGGMTY